MRCCCCCASAAALVLTLGCSSVSRQDIAVQIEEPFSILPLEAMCNGAIAACQQEMIEAWGYTAGEGVEPFGRPQ